MRSQKLFLILTITFIAILLWFNPVLAGERKVLGLNLPLTSAICYETESAANRSWIISGLLYTDSSFLNYDITLSGYSGMRFYNGDAAGRIYLGLYGSGSIVYLEPNHLKTDLGTIAVLGYEYRFGSDKNARVFVGGGWTVYYSTIDQFHNGPAVEAGIGFNLN